MIINVILDIKGENGKEEAEKRLIGLLNNWICEPPNKPPFPNGALLYWNIAEVEIKE